MINHKKENKQNKKNLTYKISFNLLEKDFNSIDNLAKEKNIKIADLIRLALANYIFMKNEISKGSEIIIEDKDGKMNKIMFK